VNFSLGKTFSIWENMKFQIRADASNIFNHPSFNLPNGNISVTTNAAGNVVTTTGTSNINSLTINGRYMSLLGKVTF
jgi:hypothetical protein